MMFISTTNPLADCPLTTQQIGAVIQAVTQYVVVLRQAEGGKHWPPTDADVMHSALLYRLLSGKPALSAPPPLTHSSPCYALGEGEAYEAFSFGDYPSAERPNRVLIDACSDWDWVERGKTLCHVPTGDLYRVVGEKTIQKIPGAKAERIAVKDAASSLREHFGYGAYAPGGWLQSIGVGGDKIYVMANREPRSAVPDQWCGWPIEMKVVGPLFPLGSDPNAWEG